MGGKAKHWRMWLVLGLCVFVLILSAAHYLDLPHLLFGMPARTVSLAEIAVEAFLTFLAGVFLWKFLGWLETTLNASMRELHRLATQDDLTGIPNRRQCLERLAIEFERARRFQRPLSVAIIDLDGFKSINDRQGHLAGDNTLVNFTRVVTRYVRAQDFFGRLGGDEFLVIFLESDLRDGAVILERIREQWALAYAPTIVRGSAPVTLSAGITSPLPGDKSLTDLLRRADEGLIRAKTTGRNRIAMVPGK